MSQKCQGCTKTVYSNEWLKAIAGYWHKGCLKCTECGVTLNLKNVESFDKKPYCKTHLPKAGHTQVADSVATRQALSAPKRQRQAGVKTDERRTFAPGSMQAVRGRGRGRGGPGRGGARGGGPAAGGPPRGGGAAAGGPPRGAAAPRGAPRGGGGGGGVRVGGGGNKCPGCGKTVYPNEQLKAVNGVWHKGCLKCTDCGVTLNLKNVESFDNKPYCKTHLPKAGHTQVADSVATRQALSAPKRQRQAGIKTDERRTFAPGSMQAVRGRGGGRGGAAPAKPRGGGQARSLPFKTGGNKCTGCSKTVYDNEAIRACNSVWHKGCLKCSQCGLTLNLKNVESFDNTPYCKAHLPTANATQVADSFEVKQATSAPKARDVQSGISIAPQNTPAAAAPPGAGGAAAGGSYEYTSSDPASHQEDYGYDDTYEPAAPAPAAAAPPAAAPAAEAYDEGGYDEGGYDEAGYDEAGYDEAGYDEAGYDEAGYGEAEAYEEAGYAEGEAEAEAYDEGAYAEGGAEAYDEAGYAEGGEAYYEGEAEGEGEAYYEGEGEAYYEGEGEGYYDEGEGYYDEGEGYYDEGEGYYDEGEGY